MAKHYFQRILLAAACSGANFSFADFYVGGQTGSVNWDDGNGAISFDAYVGYQFSEFLAAEIAYTNLGDFDTKSQSDTFTNSIAGASYSVVGLLPLDDTFSLKGKVTYFDYAVDVQANGKSFLKADAADFIYSAGLDMNIAEHINLSLEYRFIPLKFNLYSKSEPRKEFSHGQTETADNLSLGLNIAF